ncbi:hypothetical protein Hanom_Chr05g00414631 [Helianthus anomalus]
MHIIIHVLVITSRQFQLYHSYLHAQPFEHFYMLNFVTFQLILYTQSLVSVLPLTLIFITLRFMLIPILIRFMFLLIFVRFMLIRILILRLISMFILT